MLSTVKPFNSIASKQKLKAETVIFALKASTAVQDCDLRRCNQATACLRLYLDV
jgi:hypothetical protein